MLDSSQIEHQLATAFPDAHIEVEGDDGRHFHVKIIDALFTGKSRVQRHQMVYSVVSSQIASGQLHALELKVYTPLEWQQEWTN